jgi:hypothetical protein
VREQSDQHREEPPAEYKKFIESEGEFKKVQLDLRVLNKTVFIGTAASQEE